MLVGAIYGNDAVTSKILYYLDYDPTEMRRNHETNKEAAQQTDR